MTTGATDAALVQAHLRGDRDALGSIYDRYAASLYDTATVLLRDRDEAADAMQDTFVAAAQHLGQLRDPTRLRAWLFAVLRHEVERRGRRRGRLVPTAEVADVAAPVHPDPAAQLEGAELAEVVRAAAAGLDERDQLVLELSLRQGLDGADLAAALGVTAAQSYTLVFRMRDRVSRSLGALVVARSGRRDCAELDTILQGWDGRFSVLVRKRVARHVEQCDVCERTKARAALPALFGVAPAFALPLGLRAKVLARVEGAPPSALLVDGDGFPRTTRRGVGGHGVPRRWVAAGAAAVVLAVGGVAAMTLVRAADGDTTQAVTVGTAPLVPATTAPAPPTTTAFAATSAATTVPPATTVPVTTSTIAPTTTAPPAAPPTPLPPAPPAAPGRLALSATSLGFGSARTTLSVELRNTGGSQLGWSVGPVTAPFVAGGGGFLPAGGRAVVNVTLDRASLAEGDLAGTLTIASSVGSRVVGLTGSVERAPVLRSITFADAAVRVGGCAPRATTVTITASDASALTVTARLTPPGGRSSSLALTATGGRWTGAVGPFAAAGTSIVQVVATDARGNSSTAEQSLPVVACTR